MERARIYPFSLHRFPEKSRPRFSFIPENYSIEVDNHDEKFKSGLRRKSFTGETPHPILRQLSGGKVSIPVEHVEDDDELDSYDSEHGTGTAVHTPQIIQREKTPSINYARKQEDVTSSNQVLSQKLKPRARKSELFASLEDDAVNRDPENDLGRSNYDPKKYQDYWPIESNVDDHKKSPDGYDVEINKKLGKDLQKLSVQYRSNEDRKNSVQQSAREEHEAEVRKQDDFMKKQYKLHRFLIVPDGNCLYRAVAQATLGDQSQHLLLRQLAVDHIREHKVEFKDIIEGDVDVFLSAAQLEGEWAGYPEILALSRLLEININITTGGTPSNPKVHTRLHYFAPTDPSDKVRHLTAKDKVKFTQRESIWLSWLCNGHYDSFTDKVMENPHYENWLQSRESRIRSDAAIANRIQLDETSQVLYNNDPIYNKEEDLNSKESEKSPRMSQRRPHDNVNDWYTATLDAAYKSSVDDLSSRSPPKATFLQATAPPPEPQYYPAATYTKNHPGSTSRVESPPYSSSLLTSTEHDEEIARNLQNEEEDAVAGFPRYGGFHFV